MIFKNKYNFREKAVVFVKNFSCEETNYNSERLSVLLKQLNDLACF